MVNHVYTLLLDRPGQGFATGDGEEYTEAAYRPRPRPAYLDAVRAALYGVGADRRTVTYRARQFLAVLHAGPLAGHVAAADPRITYLPLAGVGFELVPAIAVTPLGGHAFTLDRDGPAPQGLVTGRRAAAAWTVAVGAGGTLAIAGDDGVAVVATPEFHAGLAAPVPLPGTALAVRVRAAAPPGTAWRVEVRGRPEADCLGTTIAALERAGAATLDRLLGAGAEEPGRTWRAVWGGRLLPAADRLSAALLALAARTDESRQGGGGA